MMACAGAVAQDPSLPLVDQDDTKRDAQNHCVVLSLVLSEAEAKRRTPGYRHQTGLTYSNTQLQNL